MRRVLQLLGLSGLLVTGLTATEAVAQEPGETEEPPKSETAAPVSEPSAAPEAVAAAPAPSALPPAARPKVGDISSHGYFRAGFGATYNEKGRQTCFGLYSINGGLKSKYRLGNECEQWGELELTTVVYSGDDGVVGSAHFMPVVFIPTTFIGYSPSMTTSAQDQQGQGSSGATVAFPNLYADLKGISWLYGGTAWAGSRYYKREAAYISDFFYWNPSGIGAGIEDAFRIGAMVDNAPDVVRDMSFSYGAFAMDGQPVGNPYLPQRYALGVRNDFQIRGFRPYPGGELQLGFQYIANWSSDTDDSGDKARTSGGWGVTIRHVQQVLGGDNKLVFQYGRGGGTGFGTLARFYYPDFSLNQETSESRLRVVDVLTVQPAWWFGGQGVFVFQRDDLNSYTAGDWYSAGGRLAFAPSQHFKVLWESGIDLVKPKNDSGTRDLHKHTLALAFAGASGFWARPELRFYVTYAQWNEKARTAHVDSFDLYLNTNKLSGAIAGVQAEAMW